MKFIGHYYHALEQKGRLAIPTAFRKSLGKTAIITRGLDGCLYIFPESSWEKITKEAVSQPFTKKNSREWVRLLTHNAHKVFFDSQGRMLIPEHLRDYAKLDHKVVVAGSLDKIELWENKKYKKYMEKLEGQAEEIAERLSFTNQE